MHVVLSWPRRHLRQLREYVGISVGPTSFCTTTGVKTFESEAKFLPRGEVMDPDLTNNVQVIIFDVLVVSPATDTDGDGIPDAQDNCPTVPNTDQRPSVAAALVPVGTGDNEGSVGNDDDEGRFRVEFSATNPCDLSLSVAATLSGPGFSVEVTDGQIVELELEGDGAELMGDLPRRPIQVGAGADMNDNRRVEVPLELADAIRAGQNGEGCVGIEHCWNPSFRLPDRVFLPPATY